MGRNEVEGGGSVLAAAAAYLPFNLGHALSNPTNGDRRSRAILPFRTTETNGQTPRFALTLGNVSGQA